MPRLDADRFAFERAGGRAEGVAAFLQCMEAERSVPGETAFASGWDSGGVFVLSEHGLEIRCLKRYDIGTGTLACLTPTNGPNDLAGPIWTWEGDAECGSLAGFRWRTELGTSNEWSDARMSAAESMLSRTFAGVRPEWMESSTVDPLRWIVSLRFADKPPVWADVDAGAGTVRILSEFPEPVPGMTRRVFRWRASDGKELCGIVSFPAGDGPFPLVVFPHGGPGALSDGPFDERAWALVDSGFAVIQPNYRGSAGLGKGFRFAGWGPDGFSRALEDIQEAAVAVLEDPSLPVSDTKPVLFGGSWGGWCVLELLARHPGFYAGGISLFGAFDLPELVRWEAKRIANSGTADSESNLRTLFRQFGAPSDEQAMERLAERSPARHAGTIAAPVVLFHNRQDAVIPFAQSEAMYAALTNAGSRAKFRTGDGGHGFPSADEADLYGEIADIFRNFLSD